MENFALQPVPKAPGIYAIWCLVNDRVYVGKSKNLYRRYDNYRRDLSSGKCHNPKLQRAWDKYGSSQFVFDLLVSSALEHELDQLERFYTLELKANTREGGFNIIEVTADGGSRTRLLTGQHKQKIAQSHKGRIVSAETRKKLSEANAGKKLSISSITKREATRRERAEKLELCGEVHSLAEWCAIRGLKYQMVWKRLRKGWTLERALAPATRPAKLTITHDEAKTTIDELALKVGISRHTVAVRYSRGVRGEDLVRKSTRGYGPIEYNGRSQTLPEWCRELGLKYSTAQGRYRMGWSTERILNTTHWVV